MWKGLQAGGDRCGPFLIPHLALSRQRTRKRKVAELDPHMPALPFCYFSLSLSNPGIFSYVGHSFWTLSIQGLIQVFVIRPLMPLFLFDLSVSLFAGHCTVQSVVEASLWCLSFSMKLKKKKKKKKTQANCRPVVKTGVLWTNVLNLSSVFFSET